MAVGKFLKSGGLAALAAGLALAAVPVAANAQDHDRGGWRGGNAGEAQTGEGSRGRDGRYSREGAQRAERSRMPQRAEVPQQAMQQTAPPVATQAAPPAGGGWRSRGSDGGNGQSRGGRRGWRSGDGVAGSPPAVPQTQTEQRHRDWSGRNRSYADPDRNRSYRDGARDERRADERRDRRDERRAHNEGWRDSNRWNYRDNWRHDRRYDWSGYRDSHRHIYRPGRYYAPYRNYHYRRFSIGFYLDSLFFGSRYWIADPWYYRLPPAYGPYRWVRYYDDVLLVDIYTGEVVDVIYDFFW